MNILTKKLLTLVGVITVLGTASVASAASLSDEINHEVTNIDNGAVITITSDNADLVAKIIERAERADEKGPKNEDVTKEVEVLDNGVKITVTTEDEDLVSEIQERVAQGPPRPHGGCHEEGEEGPQHGGPQGRGAGAR